VQASCDDLTLNYIPPDFEDDEDDEEDDEQKSSTTLRSAKRRLVARMNEEDAKIFRKKTLPEEMVLGKTSETPAPESDDSTNQNSIIEKSYLRIHYEVLPFNGIEGLSHLLDGAKI